jgi:hypothetical protein
MPSPRVKKAVASSATAKLLDAFTFVSPAYKEPKKDGNSGGNIAPYQQYCRIVNKQVIAFDGVIGFGHPIDEEITICPHLGQLLDAVKRAGSTLSLTELDSGRLSMKGDNLRVIIPCVDGSIIPPVMPDPRCGEMNDEIKAAFAVVNPLVKEGDQNVRWIETACLMRANTIFATNGHVALEYWHGIDLPPGLTIPKIAINAIAKTTKKLTGFGFGPASVTFYFEDGAWIRTQIFSEVYPDVMNNAFRGLGPNDLNDVPPTLFAAIENVRHFSATSAVFLGPGIVKSHPADGVGADYPVEGLLGYCVMNGEYAKIIAPHAKKVQLNTDEETRPVIFFGDKVRGCLMKMRG